MATASFQIRITPPIRPPRTRLSATTPTVPEMPKPIGISVNIFPMPKRHSASKPDQEIIGRSVFDEKYG